MRREPGQAGGAVNQPQVIFQSRDDARIVIGDPDVRAWRCPRVGKGWAVEVTMADGTELASCAHVELDDAWADVAEQWECHKLGRGACGYLRPVDLESPMVTS